MNTLVHDLRHAARALLARPTFLLTAVLTLTLGIGAVAAIFTVYDAVLLKPLPYANAERIVRVTREQPPATLSTISAQAFEEWHDRSGDVFEAMGAFVVETRNLTSAGEAQRLTVYKVTPGFWDVFGQPLALGRAFGDVEEKQNERVVVLGDALWRTQFGADAAVIGRDIELNGEAFRVVGVAAPSFRYPNDVQVWIPTFLPGNTTRTRGMNYLRAVARLRDGVSLAQAKAAMLAIADWQAHEYPEHAGMSADVTPLRDLLSSDVRQPLHMLLLAAALVLLIACANLANLMLARGQARGHELALRSAIGAGRARLVRQVLAESLLIAAIGAAAGLAVAKPAIAALTSFAPDLLPAYNVPAIDLRVIATTAAVALATLLLFGLLPAWRAAQSSPLQALQGASRSQTGTRAQMRARAALVSAEIALALTLLAGASLLIDSLRQLGKVDSGIGSPQVLTAAFSIALPAQQPGDVLDDWAARTIGRLAPRLDAIEQQLRRLPGVESVALANRLPASGDWGWNSAFTIPGRSVDDKAAAEWRFVSADYFRTFGIPVEAGRVFTATDGADSLYPTQVLINQAFADRYLAGDDPLSREITIFGDAPKRIVGVVANVRQAGLDRPPNTEVYFPVGKAAVGDLVLALKVQGNAMAYAEPLRRAMREVAPDVPLYSIRTMDEVTGSTMRLRQFNMFLMSTFALVALVLAAIGLYGVIAFAVGQRRREIGLRQAIGASGGDIHRLMLGAGLRMIVPGLVAGLLGALVLGRAIASQLYGVGAADPLVLAGVTTLLALAAVAACAIPTLRAARVAPMEALRNE
ncbi:ADOP family duplicated permease [Dokdonella sp.]|uniref:ADOP family duplicated permease n=1 Tax=Dokdonella sp. TaxID=2291710 RepID=UPI0026091A11|nr:ADOP family duplicated permease [Dokdonella sp.]